MKQRDSKQTPVMFNKQSTHLGMPIFQGDYVRQLHQTSTMTFPVKYTVTLTQKELMLSGSVVTHLELEDWLMMKGFELFDLENVEIALPYERTQLGT